MIKSIVNSSGFSGFYCSPIAGRSCLFCLYFVFSLHTNNRQVHIYILSIYVFLFSFCLFKFWHLIHRLLVSSSSFFSFILFFSFPFIFLVSNCFLLLYACHIHIDVFSRLVNKNNHRLERCVSVCHMMLIWKYKNLD